MEDPSTIRRAVADIGRAPYGGDSLAGQTGGIRWLKQRLMGTLYPICSGFAICSFLDPGYCPYLTLSVLSRNPECPKSIINPAAPAIDLDQLSFGTCSYCVPWRAATG